MFYIAFTLGLFGSLHCLGMCGPLAFALLPGIEKGGLRSTIRVLGYNFGRVLSYISLGVITGIVSGGLNLTGIQKPLTLFMGALMILLFFMSMDLEKVLFRSEKYRLVFNRYRNFISRFVNKGTVSSNSLLLGAINGLIPCGLVYLALAGAITSGGLLNSAMFMLFFGLGTIPAMVVLLSGASLLQVRRSISLKKVFAYLQLFVGIFLIYRAIAVELPDNLELYWSMGRIMCH